MWLREECGGGNGNTPIKMSSLFVVILYNNKREKKKTKNTVVTRSIQFLLLQKRGCFQTSRGSE